MKVYLLLGVLILSLGTSLAACSSPTPTPPPVAEEPEVDCAETEVHPVAQGMAEKYGVSYEQVIAWACSGETLEDILLALETSKLTGRPVDELLAMRKKLGWDGVWDSLGLVPEQAQQGQ